MKKDNGLTNDMVFSFGRGLMHSINPFYTKLYPTSIYLHEIYGNDYNSYNYRCDEFSNIQNGKTILFSGCSVTFGEGLEKEETWPWMVYSKIKESTEVSGYFNLAMPGTSLALIIMRLFKYFNEFGNPDVIFLNIPPMTRFLSIIDDENGDRNVVTAMMDEQQLAKKGQQDSIFFAKAINFELYNMLDLYCKNANIKLISFSWLKPGDGSWHDNFADWMSEIKNDRYSFANPAELLNGFSSYTNIYNKYNLEKYIDRYIQKMGTPALNKIKIPYIYARDKAHPGIIKQSFFANAALNIWDKNKYKEILEV